MMRGKYLLFVLGILATTNVSADMVSGLSSLFGNIFKASVGGAVLLNNANQTLKTGSEAVSAAQGNGFWDQAKGFAAAQQQQFFDNLNTVQTNGQVFIDGQRSAVTGSVDGAVAAVNNQGNQLNANLANMNTTAQQQGNAFNQTVANTGGQMGQVVSSASNQLSNTVNTSTQAAVSGISDVVNTQAQAAVGSMNNLSNVVNNQGNQLNQNVVQAGNQLNQTAAQTGAQLNQNAAALNTTVAQQGAQLNQNVAQTGSQLNQNVMQAGNQLNQTAAQTGAQLNQNAAAFNTTVAQQGAQLNQNVAQTGNQLNQNVVQAGANLNTTAAQAGANLNATAAQKYGQVQTMGSNLTQAVLTPMAVAVDATAFASQLYIAPTTLELSWYISQLTMGVLAQAIAAQNSPVMAGISRDMTTLATSLHEVKKAANTAMQIDGYIKLSEDEFKQFTADKQAALEAAARNEADGVAASANRLMEELDHAYYQKYLEPNAVASILAAKTLFAQNITPSIQGLVTAMAYAHFIAFANGYEAMSGRKIQGVVAQASGDMTTAYNAVLQASADTAAATAATAQATAAQTQAATQQAAAATVQAHSDAVDAMQEEIERQEEPERGDMGLKTVTVGDEDNQQTVIARR